jgi:hypothetical protein
MEKKLNNLVKENLIKTKQMKESLLVKERRIIEKRFSLITENKIVKTESQKEEVVLKALNEVAKMMKENFNHNLINEQWGSLISDIGRGSWETIQENIVRQLLVSLGMDKNSFMTDLIAVSISNIKLHEITKLLDCKYLSGEIAQNLGETMALRLQHSVGGGMESGFANTLRNTLAEIIGESNIGQKMQSKIAEFICPVVQKFSGKFSESFGNKSIGSGEKPAG